MIYPSIPRRLLGCSIDPVTAIGLAVAGIGGAAASGAFSGGGAAPSPTMPQQSPPQQTPIGNKAQNQSTQPSFVGQSAVPQQGYGQKTLLGQ